MDSLIHIILIIIPMLGVLGGLSLSFTISLFLLLLLAKFRKKLKFKLTVPLVAILGWFFISCFWSPDSAYSFKICISLILPAIAVTTLIYSTDNEDRKHLESLFWRPLMIGIIGSIVVFMVEYYTHGIFSMSFRNMQGKEGIFVLSWLDRGCVFLSIVSWLIIAALLKRGYKYIPLSIYVTVLVMLTMSDSLSGVVAYILAGTCWFVMYSTKMKLGLILRICVALSIFTMPIASLHQNPHSLSSYDIPASAKHRLFIWNFVAKKSILEPVLGYGFASSRYIASKNDVVNYDQYEWSLLPLHPHNNSLQILLETGIVGLLLFALLLDNILKFIIRNSSNVTMSSTILSCFVNYFFVSMISFGMWQTWWVMASAFVFLYARIYFSEPTDVAAAKGR